MEPNKNNISNRMKIIDRIINAYKAKKLMLQAQQIQQDGIKEENNKSYKSISKRMKDAHKKNQRQKKIDKLQAIKTHWKGLN